MSIVQVYSGTPITGPRIVRHSASYNEFAEPQRTPRRDNALKIWIIRSASTDAPLRCRDLTTAQIRRESNSTPRLYHSLLPMGYFPSPVAEKLCRDSFLIVAFSSSPSAFAAKWC